MWQEVAGRLFNRAVPSASLGRRIALTGIFDEMKGGGRAVSRVKRLTSAPELL
jgi:hypothetical protein